MTQKQNKTKKNIKPKRKNKKILSMGNVYIQSSFNNTMITITDQSGDVVTWASAGSIGFKGTKKSTPYAAQLAATQAIEKARSAGLSKVSVFISGVGSGRESAVRALINSKIDVDIIKDVTPVPHNGCRPKKARRV